MTQLQAAQQGIITDAMRRVAEDEKVTPEQVRDAVARGHAVIPLNPAHANARPVGVGRLFSTKVNANLGRSTTRSGKGDELEKLQIALKAGADFVMDLSVGADLRAIRQGMLDASPVPLGTVPVYETISRLAGDVPEMNPDLLLQVIREQAEQGVDFMTLHAGLLRGHVDLAMRRIMGIVSRGGAIMAEWMKRNQMENPLYTHWDEVLDILVEHDVTVSLGDGLRPGCLADASDAAQFGELDVLGELVQRCRVRGVQVMVEGPGHVPFNQIQMNMARQQKVCDGAPFYVLGPVVTDIAPGYDHITSCIGATAAATYGASLLCYVTPAEHLGLPDGDEVHQGMIAYRIAAHAGDVARGLPGARERDDAMSRARMAFHWEAQFVQALDPERARARWLKTRACSGAATDDHCSMCGKEFCAMRTTTRIRSIQP
ncbi:MAG TPA: phosphomethylpyrimidine synthase ThiC [Kiritimatiellia bacterium]|nr:phosphomethylpyrimidine synthase ThiC [Kiritimatiellia bacterium]HRU71356.1 phosphomethylpyrimidine synthase ThiC [Kiritimatiellia bacterium]